MKLPGGVLVQAALVSQLLAGVEHTSISDVGGGINCIVIIMSCLPEHVTPFPVYPWLQVQVKLPGGVLAQAALVSQLLAPLEHSSISDVGEGNNCIVIITSRDLWYIHRFR